MTVYLYNICNTTVPNISHILIEMLHQPRPLPHAHSPLQLVHFAALSLSMTSGYQEEHKNSQSA